MTRAVWGVVGLGAGLGTLILGVRLAQGGFLLRVPVGGLVIWALAVAAAVGAALAARRHWPAPSARRIGARIESWTGWRRGSVWAVAEPCQAGASPDLFDSADRGMAARLAREGGVPLRDAARSGLARLVVTAGGTTALLLFLAALEPTAGRAADLWHPMRLAFGARPPLTISADRLVVPRGDTVRLRIAAPGALHATVWTRVPGEGWRGSRLSLDSIGRGALLAGPLEADLSAHATAGSRRSDTVRIRVSLPLLLQDLAIEARFPPHVGRLPEPLGTGPDTAWIPAGTVIGVEGRLAGADVGRAAWLGRGAREPLVARGSRFRGQFAPRTSGRWVLTVEAGDGGVPEGEAPVLVLGILPDRPPEVAITFPARDAALPFSLIQPLVVDVRDDYGVAAAEVVLRRVSRFGIAGTPWSQALPLAGEPGERAVLSAELDLRDRGLLPGDTVRVFARAADNAPRSQWGRSADIALRLPSLAELRDETRRQSDAVASGIEAAAAQQRALSRETEALAAERQRGGDTGAQSTDERRGDLLGFERAERAAEVAREQTALAQRVGELREALAALERAARAAALDDPEWQRQLEELGRLLDRALTPELAQRVRELRAAVERLDELATREALTRLAEAQTRLREELERSRALLERAAIEGTLERLARDAEDLVGAQERWAEAAERGGDSLAATREQELAARADSLAGAIEEAAREAATQSADTAVRGVEAGAEGARRAAGQMRTAADAASAGRSAQAALRGREAAGTLARVADALREARRSLARGWRDEVLAALDRSLAETARLAREQQDLAEQLRRGDSGAEIRGRQGALEQGVDRLAEQMRQVARMNALLSPDLAMAFGFAQERMGRARAQLERPVPNAREAGQYAGEALEALNTAAHALVRGRGEIAAAQSGSGLAEAIERLGELARRQGALNAHGAELMPQLLTGAEIAEQLQRLAREQRAIARELERALAEGAPGSPQRLAEEAEAVAGELERGRLDPEVLERQERLFRRLLDAGRWLESDEPDPERERRSETAQQRVPWRPAAAERAVGGGPRFPYPTWEDLAGLSPEARRLVLEYFRRLNRAEGRP